MKKTCSKCKKYKHSNKFSKHNNTKDGFQYWCKTCLKLYNKSHKEEISVQRKQHYKKNKEKILIEKKQYYAINKEAIIIKANKYKLEHKGKILRQSKKYYEKYSKYLTFCKKLTVDESPKLSKDGVSLEVKCRYCGKYFIPTNRQVRNRISALNSDKTGDQSLYCSTNCKIACPIFNQIKYPKGFKKASSREVNPLIRQMCFERDDWECQICGRSIDEIQLHSHHIEGVAQNPLLSNDVKNTVTFCKDCHKEVHKLPGCSYHELKCKKDQIWN